MNISSKPRLVSKRWASISVLSLLALLAISSSTAVGQCKNWNPHAETRLFQSNTFRPNDLSMWPVGNRLGGRAFAYTGRTWNGVQGEVGGTLKGDKIRIEISWKNGLIGIYEGTVSITGRVSGTAYEVKTPRITHAWHLEHDLKCFEIGPPVPESRPRLPPSKVGPPKPPPTPAPPTPPFIIAGQAIIPTPYHPMGIVHLGWDGGPDHPNVAVWVSIDNGAEIPAFSIEHAAQSPVWKQPKIASIQLNLQRKHHYRFVLKGAGKTLSTAAFVVP